MSEDELKYLVDIEMAIIDIQEIIGNVKNFHDFNNNKEKKYAVERCFAVIGEAIKNFKNINNEIEISHTKEIIGLRNRIVHSYDSINYEHLWAIVINHLPKLKIEVDFLINKFEKNN
jgi:uncharacterized protein with HEPN domain